ncbi:ThiF family adenylyltransferase [Corynebacterium sphenisci]|uniref:ThiF family adenylyltransferase n=1 Tax=Corynebacterium sphenisci TaxID=191493 RepID=UPI0026DED80E|nr:ThiF family adenylyltransferase [Corynebacterium sphenisci]MDO5731032.1 ThiF family adenylyltransferase [Corynebacterium sphenisci]
MSAAPDAAPGGAAGLDRDQVSRYRRQLMLDRFGAAGQRALLRARVAVVGAGGLGSPALLYLAGAGVGHLHIIDDDVVGVSNLHRQVIHPQSAVGVNKAASAAARVRELNPGVVALADGRRLTAGTAAAVLADAEVVLDCTDNFAARHIISAACAELGIPHVWGAILGYGARLSVFHAGRGPVYEDLVPAPPDPAAASSCVREGVLGPVPGIVGAAMAGEAIKLICGVGEPLLGTVGSFDMLTGRWEYIPVLPGGADPRAGAPGPAPDAAGPAAGPDDPAPVGPGDLAGAVLLDVREPCEFSSYAIPGAVNAPLSALRAGEIPGAARAAAASGGAVVVCSGTGRRARVAAGLLAAAGVAAAVLDGGVEAWLDAGGDPA